MRTGNGKGWGVGQERGWKKSLYFEQEAVRHKYNQRG